VGWRRATEPEALIERYVEPNPHHVGPADVRLREHCVPVWALVGYWKAAEGDVERVAADYRLPREAVEAAIAYYKRNQAVIDARIAANAA
jgi:uncharacterized protein (DUF433 family)